MHIELVTLSMTVPLHVPLPVRGMLRQQLYTATGDEYWLVELERPLPAIEDLGVETIRYLLMWPEPGTPLDPEARKTYKTGVDVVLDESLAQSDFLDFGKCRPVGVGRLVVGQSKVA